MHMNLEPIRLARSVSCAPSGMVIIGTRAAAPRRSTASGMRTLVMTLRIGRVARHGARKRVPGRLLPLRRQDHRRLAIRQEGHESSEYDDQATEPNPLHQRIQIRMNHGKTG